MAIDGVPKATSPTIAKKGTMRLTLARLNRGDNCGSKKRCA